MKGGAGHRDFYQPDAAEITDEYISNKTENVECRDGPQIAGTGCDGLAVSIAGEQRGQGNCFSIHEQTQCQSHGGEQKKSVFYAQPHPVFFPGTPVLGSEYGQRLALAVSKGVGKAFDPRGCRITVDRFGSQGINRSLNQQFSDIKAGLMESSGKAER